MTYAEAWALYKKRHIVLPDEQTFRHGWNAALAAAASLVDGRRDECEPWMDGNDVRALEVEVYT